MGKNHGTHGIGGWVGLRAHLDIVKKINSLASSLVGSLERAEHVSFLYPEMMATVRNTSGNYLETVFITWLWSGNGFII